MAGGRGGGSAFTGTSVECLEPSPECLDQKSSPFPLLKENFLGDLPWLEMGRRSGRVSRTSLDPALWGGASGRGGLRVGGASGRGGGASLDRLGG